MTYRWIRNKNLFFSIQFVSLSVKPCLNVSLGEQALAQVLVHIVLQALGKSFLLILLNCFRIIYFAKNIHHSMRSHFFSELRTRYFVWVISFSYLDENFWKIHGYYIFCKMLWWGEMANRENKWV